MLSSLYDGPSSGGTACCRADAVRSDKQGLGDARVQKQASERRQTDFKLDTRGHIGFRPKIPAGGEAVITYTVHYSL